MTTYFRTCTIKNEGLNLDSFYKREHVMSNYKDRPEDTNFNKNKNKD